MTEEQWARCDRPEEMLAFLRASGLAGGRKLRLFAAAVARKVLDPLDDPRCLEAVAAAERFADGLADAAELGEAHTAVQELLDEAPDAYDAVSEAAYAASYATAADL